MTKKISAAFIVALECNTTLSILTVAYSSTATHSVLDDKPMFAFLERNVQLKK